jgi:TnpA family transposase
VWSQRRLFPDALQQPVLTRPIKWDLIKQQYDEMIKFATALRLGTAEPEEILRRFTSSGVVLSLIAFRTLFSYTDVERIEEFRLTERL